MSDTIEPISPRSHHDLTDKPDLVMELTNGDGIVTDRAFVTRSSVANASPIWRRMVEPDSGFKPLRRETYKMTQGDQELPVLSLTDDDFKAWLTILEITHLKMGRVLQRLSYQRFLELAKTCDKYNCAELVRPWLKDWIWELLSSKEHDAYEPGHEGWFLITTVFPWSDELTKLVHGLSVRVTQTCYNCKPGSFVRCSQKPPQWGKFVRNQLDSCPISSENIPSPILEHIYKQRESGIQSLKKMIVDFCDEMCLFSNTTINLVPSQKTLLSCTDEVCIDISRSTLILSFLRIGFQLHSPETLEDFLATTPFGILCHELSKLECKTVALFRCDPDAVRSTIDDFARQEGILPQNSSFLCLHSFPQPPIAKPGNPGHKSKFVVAPLASDEKTPVAPQGCCGIAKRLLKFYEDVKLIENSIFGYQAVRLFSWL